MTIRLLVSVRNRAEARLARAAGAEHLDLKNPSAGPLGTVDPDELAATARDMPTGWLSAAGGELLRDEPTPLLERLKRGDLTAVRVFKIGLAGMRGLDWSARLRTAAANLPDHCEPALVLYADHAACDAPGPDELHREFARGGLPAGCRLLLIDTYFKDGRGLFAHLAPAEVAETMHAARTAWGLSRTALAGALRERDFPTVRRLAPDWIAVRGAVCRDGGRGELDPRACAATVAWWREHGIPAEKEFPTPAASAAGPAGNP